MAIVYLQLQTSYICAGQYCANVQHFGIEDPTQPNAFRLARDLVDHIVVPIVGDPLLEKLANCLSEDSYISSLRCIRLTDSGAAYSRLFAADNWPGQFSGNLAAQQVAAYIKWGSTGHAGKTGGNFIPGVSEDALDANRFTNDYKAAIDEYMDLLIDGIAGTAGTFLPYIPMKVGLGTEFIPVTNGQLSATPGTIRKRLIPV